MALRDAEPLRDEPTTLERFFTTLGRPQYALSSLATGQFQDAAENVARFGEEVLTGSWLHGYSALNLLPGDWGTNDRSERPEGADVLRRFGAHIDRGSWGELGANVVGGALLDPLTYVGGIGLGSKVGRVAKGAITGLGAADAAVDAAARSTLTRALSATPEGLRALRRTGSAENLLLGAIHAADAQPTIQRVLAEETARVAAAQRGGSGILDDLLTGFAPGSLDEAAFQQLARKRAAERIGLDLGDNRVRLIGTDAQAELLDAGIRGLEGQRLLKPAGVPTLEIPGLTWHALPGGAEQWSRIGLATPAHALNGLIGLASPGLAEGLGKIAADAAQGLRTTFVDRLARTGIPDALQSVAASLGGKIAQADADTLERVSGAAHGLGPDADRAIGKLLLTEDDLMRKGVTPEQADAALTSLGGAPSPRASLAQDILNGRFDPNVEDSRVLLDADFRGELPTLLNVKAKARGAGYTGLLGFLSWVKNENRGARFVSTARTEAGQKMFTKAEKAGLLRPAGQGVFDTFEVVGDPDVLLRQIAGETTTAEAIRKTLPWLPEGEASDRMRAAWAATREKIRAIGGEAGVGAVDAYVDDVRKIPQELVDAGVWKSADATPFYFPHQANDAMALFLASGPASKRVGSGGLTYAEALADSFTRSRSHANLAETLASFRKVAEHYGVPIPDLTDFGAHESDLGSVFETSLTKLWARRMMAHNGTVGRANFEKAARSVVTDLRHATVLDQFLDASLRGVGARGTVLGKLLGGGEFRATGAAAEAARSAAPWLGGQAAAVGGEAGWVYKWPGLNAFVKPALYLPAVATYTRNALGGVVMGAMDPEIGLGGASGLASVLRDLPIVRALTGGPARDLQAAMVAAARGREPGISLAGRTIGGHSAEEVVEHLRGGVIGQNAVSDRELMESVGSVADFVREQQTRGAGGWEAFKGDMRAAFTGKGLTAQTTSASAIERYRRFWAPAGRLNQAVEDGLRSGAYFKLIGAGYDPATAAKRVRDTFVDYAYQSGTERALRDALPFVRFTLGAGPNAVAGSTGLVGRAVGRAAVGSDDGRPIPTELQRQVSIPIPGMPDTYATSLGLPQEAGGALLGLIPGAQGFYRNAEQNVLGALSPQPKALLEATTGKQFYSDLPLSEVKPIANLPPFASHALFGFLPLSRFWGETKKFIDAAHGDVRQTVNFLTGVKLRTVDSEREAEAVLRRYLERAVQEGDVQSMTRFFAGKGEPVKPEVKAALEALAARERARRAKS